MTAYEENKSVVEAIKTLKDYVSRHTQNATILPEFEYQVFSEMRIPSMFRLSSNDIKLLEGLQAMGVEYVRIYKDGKRTWGKHVGGTIETGAIPDGALTGIPNESASYNIRDMLAERSD